MMNNERFSTDSDDTEILEKFRNLLSKYQNQGKIISSTVASTPTTVPYADGLSQEIVSDKIPVLTEVVILHPSVIQPQPKRMKPMQQILDAALEDAHIEMSINDRKALASALETRMGNQDK